MNIDSQTQASERYEPLVDRLTDRLVKDDPDVLRDVLRLLGARTERLIRARLRSLLTDADCEDVLSIALFQLWQRRKRFDPTKSRLDYWFYLLARNAAVDLIRSKMRRHEDAIGDRAEHIPAPVAEGWSAEHSRLRRALSLALEHVSETDRRILLSGLTEKELGDELGLKPGTVRIRRLRSKQRLRSVLREMGHAV